MSPQRNFALPGLVLTLAFASFSGAAPIANPDLYFATEDTPLSVPLPGVLGNDDPNGIPGLMSAAKVMDPAHGTVSLQPDGSFLYTPAANYFGPDSFQYKAVEGQGPITFTVDQNNSPLNVDVTTRVSATGVSDRKDVDVKTKGTITAVLTPVQAPFGTVQVRTMDVAVAEQAYLEMCVVELFVCVGWLTARIEPDGLRITMREDQAGAAVPVSGSVFSQTGNLLDATGTVFLGTRGVASAITVPPTADINSTNLPYDFANSTITQSGTTLTLTVPLDITQSFVEPDYTATIKIAGTIRATAQVPTAGPESAPATVTLDILSIDDPPTANKDRYYTRQNHAISIPATGSAPVAETLIAGNSVWKYFTVSSQGTAWRAVDFVDTTWPAGTGVLGYGDGDILPAGTIPESATTGGNKYPTAYFRKEFNLTAPGATLDARVEFQRDDAVIIYVNGTEVYRDSTPYTGSTTPPLAATGEIAYATYAAAGISPDADGAIYKVVSIPANLFREGKNVIAAEVHQAGATSSDLRFDLTCFRTAQPTESLIAGGSTWKYNTGTNLGTGWRNAEYNDTAWSGAAGPLGYDADIPPASTIPSGGTTKHPTAYFRREFTLTSPFDTIAPRVEFQRDDACIIYVNGVQIYRDSTPYAGDPDPPLATTGEIAYGTYAAATIPEADSLAYKIVAFNSSNDVMRGLLREGKNVIAAEVHQAGAGSSDLRFDLRAFRTTGVGGLAGNDTDPDGPALNLQLHTAPANGSASINPDGSFTYLPGPRFPASGPSATDTFVYTHTIGGLPIITSSVVVPMGSVWRFLDNGTAAPQDALITTADWRHAAFDDAAWGIGPAQLGYGGDGEATRMEDNATPGYNAADTDRYITTYFRHKFIWNGSAPLLSRLKVRVLRDDSVAIFLNGTRITLDNLTEPWNHLTPADGTVANEATPLEVLNIPASALLEGENILSAEIHQADAASSDIRFDMELTAESVVGAKVEIVVLNDDVDGDDMSDTWERAHGIDASVANGGDDADGDTVSNRAEFLAGTDPLLLSSRLRINTITRPSAGQLALNFDSVPGHLYQIQQSDALGAWLDTGTSFPAHATSPQTVRQFAKPADPEKFYRVRVVGDWQ